MSGEPALRKLILGSTSTRSRSATACRLLHGLPEPRRLELVSSTAWADGPITQTYVSR